MCLIVSTSFRRASSLRLRLRLLRLVLKLSLSLSQAAAHSLHRVPQRSCAIVSARMRTQTHSEQKRKTKKANLMGTIPCLSSYSHINHGPSREITVSTAPVGVSKAKSEKMRAFWEFKVSSDIWLILEISTYFLFSFADKHRPHKAKNLSPCL